MGELIVNKNVKFGGRGGNVVETRLGEVKGYQTFIVAQALKQNIKFGLRFGPKKGKATFLETNHFTDRVKMSFGILSILNGGLELMREVEGDESIEDEIFESGLVFFQGLERLTAPKQSLAIDLEKEIGESKIIIIKGISDEPNHGFEMSSKRPCARRFHKSILVPWNRNQILPVITTFFLETRSKNDNEIPKDLEIDVMPIDYRVFQRGYGKVSREVIQGGPKSEVSEAMSMAGADPETVSKIISGAKEKTAYITFIGNKYSLQVDQIGETNKVLLSLTIPGGKKHLTQEIVWPENKAGGFHNFLNLINRSLKRLANKQIEKENKLERKNKRKKR